MRDSALVSQKEFLTGIEVKTTLPKQPARFLTAA